jgi:hypothetical protein
MTDTRIAFFFEPYKIEDKQYAVEKSADGGSRQRFLRGIASGPAVDGHGEKMTEKCIKSFYDQTNAGDMLLYTDKHGVAYTDDIGILTEQKIVDSGDWFVEFRLYEPSDNVGSRTLETADKLWKQVNGLPPYKHPKQKGFSIEGYIPEGGILSMDQSGRRVINEVHLDGCVVVPRPAYKTSIAQAVYKALQETPPWVATTTLQKTLRDKMDNDDKSENYYRKWYRIQEALEENIREVMDSNPKDKKRRLVMLFDEYKEMMVELIIDNESTFLNTSEPTSDVLHEAQSIYKSSNIGELYKSLMASLDSLQKKLEKGVI